MKLMERIRYREKMYREVRALPNGERAADLYVKLKKIRQLTELPKDLAVCLAIVLGLLCGSFILELLGISNQKETSQFIPLFVFVFLIIVFYGISIFLMMGLYFNQKRQKMIQDVIRMIVADYWLLDSVVDIPKIDSRMDWVVEKFVLDSVLEKRLEMKNINMFLAEHMN